MSHTEAALFASCRQTPHSTSTTGVLTFQKAILCRNQPSPVLPRVNIWHDLPRTWAVLRTDVMLDDTASTGDGEGLHLPGEVEGQARATGTHLLYSQPGPEVLSNHRGWWIGQLAPYKLKWFPCCSR